MSRKLTRCRDCQQPVVFFRSPFLGNVCPFDPKPVEPSHPLAGVKAFPVLGGTHAYRPGDLVEVLQMQREISTTEATDEVQDMPWFRIHECHTTDQKDPA